MAILCDGVLNFLLRKGMHCLHWGLLCECRWVIEREVSGTKAQRNKSKFLTPQPYFWFGALSTIREWHPFCKIPYGDIHICLFFVSSWGMGCCNDTYVQTIFLEGHGEKTIPKRYPNWTKHWHTMCLGATYSHSIFHEWKQWREKEKKNQTKQQVFKITMAMFISKCRYDGLIRSSIPYHW